MKLFFSKTNVIFLTDGDARIIEVFSSPEVLQGCHRQGIRLGTSLREESCGTNAVALALRHREPVIIRGGQHFCRLFQDWFCVAVPVISPDGQPVACIDISWNYEIKLGEKLPLVRLIADKVGQEIFRTYVVMVNPSSVRQLKRMSADLLTDKQRQVISLWAGGLSYGEISAKLGISNKTVEDHLKVICKKLGARDNKHCIKIAAIEGFLE